MSGFIIPAYSPSRVKAAGKRFKNDNANPEDSVVLDNWRAAHTYVLNTFQTNLRKRAKDKPVTAAQRLKRRPTIIDKLRREPSMQLNTMHDMAGCRIIFDSIPELEEFRSNMIYSKARHRPKSFGFIVEKEFPGGMQLMTRRDKYNYIENPKASGYRGIHDVYEYNVKSASGQKWNGLHIEIQYRTIYQHAWATAIEVADLLTTNRIKFSEADDNHHLFFELASELIARRFEQRTGPHPDLSNEDLIEDFLQIEREIGILQTFRRIKRSERTNVFRVNTILISYASGDDEESELHIENFDSINEAIARYEMLEKELSGKADVVLVRSDSEASVRFAYSNYFADTARFVSLIEEAVADLV